MASLIPPDPTVHTPTGGPPALFLEQSPARLAAVGITGAIEVPGRELTSTGVVWVGDPIITVDVNGNPLPAWVRFVTRFDGVVMVDPGCVPAGEPYPAIPVVLATHASSTAGSEYPG